MTEKISELMRMAGQIPRTSQDPSPQILHRSQPEHRRHPLRDWERSHETRRILLLWLIRLFLATILTIYHKHFENFTYRDQYQQTTPTQVL